MRYFIALKLSNKIKIEAYNIQKKLSNFSLQAKWVEFDNLHLTLKFLGSLPDDKLEEIKRIIFETAFSFPSFKLTLSNLGAFPGMRNPRVVWLGVEPFDVLSAITDKLRRRTKYLSVEKERRKPHPHITLARIKSGKVTDEFVKRAETIKVSPLEWGVDKICLFKSILHPEVPVYQEIFCADFGRTY